MKRNISRIILSLPIVLLIISTLVIAGITAYGEIIIDDAMLVTESEDDYTYNELKYTIEDGGIKITSCDKESTEVVVPDKIDGKTVVKIGDAAFYNCSKLTKVQPSGTIEEIGQQAFEGCSALAEISIPQK